MRSYRDSSLRFCSVLSAGRNRPVSQIAQVMGGVFFIALLHCPCSASAEEPQAKNKTKAGDEAQKSKEVEALYAEALELEDKLLFSEALKIFRQIQKDSSDPELYYRIGLCEFGRGRLDLSAEALSRYLKHQKKDIPKEKRELVESLLKDFQRELARLSVEAKEPLEIWVNEVLRGTAPLEEPLFLLRGERNVVLKRAGAIVFAQTYDPEKGELIEVKVPALPPPVEETAQAEEAPETSAPPKEPPVPVTQIKPRSPLKPLGFALIGVGGAALIPGVITGALYLSENNSLEEKCSDKDNCFDNYKDLHQRTRRLAIATNVLLPLGGVLAASGVVLAVTGHRIENKDEQLSFTPYFGDDAAGIAISGRF